MDTPTTARSDFASRLYDKLAGTQAGKNLFLSPFSIRVALAMCAAGARGETRRVLADLFLSLAALEELVKRDFLSDDTRLVLTNAIYFKGRWENVFEESDTRDEDWYGPNGTGKVPMMHRRGGYLYHDGGSFQALDLPYQGRQLSMLVVLPRKQDGLASLERQWAGGTAYRQVTDGLGHEEAVLVWLPRFTLETEFRLKPVLCGLHAELAFSDEADFGGIGEEPLKISEVVHKAFVEVNEEGTEAAAATAVGMVLCAGVAGPPPTPIRFRADHPFLFFIRDRRTNAVLFSGRVLDPR